MKGFFAESSQDLSPAKRNVAGENGKSFSCLTAGPLKTTFLFSFKHPFSSSLKSEKVVVYSYREETKGAKALCAKEENCYFWFSCYCCACYLDVYYPK